MENTTLNIPNISCGHCVNSIKNELIEIEGVKSVDGDPGDKTVTIEWENPATMDMIKDKLKEINYPAE